MSWVVIDGLRVEYGGTAVLDGVHLEIPRGSLTAVLGPSGCGKTTLLRAIAGLLTAAEGTIRIGGALLSSSAGQIPPEKRGVGWVPQDASLFPHLSVAENIGFGLSRCERAGSRIGELAALVGLTDLLDRAPSQLSGGQAQRVALARSLAPRPDLILLDEPFAALDPQLRSTLRRDVADVLRGQSNTSILVTHDQEEALSLADHVAVMRDGKILQSGAPWDIYEHPVTPWVAAFVGDTVELDGRWRDGRVQCDLGLVDAEMADGTAARDGRPVSVMLRPEWLHLADDGMDAVVSGVAYGGHDALVGLDLASGASVRMRLAAPHLPRPGERVTVAVRHRALAYSAAQSVDDPLVVATS